MPDRLALGQCPIVASTVEIHQRATQLRGNAWRAFTEARVDYKREWAAAGQPRRGGLTPELVEAAQRFRDTLDVHEQRRADLARARRTWKTAVYQHLNGQHAECVIPSDEG